MNKNLGLRYSLAYFVEGVVIVARLPLILITMQKFESAILYGNSDREMRLCQRAAPVRKSLHVSELYETKDYVKMEKSIKRSRKMIRYYKHYPYLPALYETRTCQFPALDESFEEQSGSVGMLERVTQLLNDMSKFANIGLTDEMLMEIEGLVALFITLQGCMDYLSMSTAIFLYVRKFFDKSVTGQVMAYLDELFENETQDGDEDLVSTSDWIQLMRNVRDNWELVKNNKLFSHFSKLLGLLVTLGLCKASSVTFEVKDIKVWEPDMKIVHGNAADIADAALSTVIFFVESISLCYTEKSLKPLLINDKAAAELDEEYANIVLWWDLVKNGNLQKVAQVSEAEFDKRLEALCGKVRDLIGVKTSFEKKLLQEKFIRLLRIKNDYITMKISSGVRKAPYCVELFGASSQGKTTLAEQIVHALLTSAGLPTGKEYQASYNSGDKFMSTWSTDKLVMFLDDMVNARSQFVERPPTQAIVDICNNQPFYANMADVDSKGRVFMEPILAMITTNTKDLDARVYSNCPYSIQRRMHAVITVKARPEFQYLVDGKPQGIDAAKVQKYYQEKGIDPTFDDLWLLTVEKAVEPESLKLSATYKVVEWRGQKLEDVPFRTVVQYLIEDFHNHLQAQECILERMKKRQRGIELCGHEGCKNIKGYCDLHDNEKQFGDDIVDSIQSAGSIISNRIKKDVFGLDTAIEGACTLSILGGARYFAKHWDWISAVPTPWLKNDKFKKIAMFLNQGKLKKSYVRKTCLLWSGVIGSMLWTNNRVKNTAFQVPVMCALGSFMTAFGVTAQKSMVEIVKSEFEKELVDRNTIEPMFRDFRDKHVGKLCKAVGFVGVLYALARVYKSWKNMREQGSLEPADEEEIAERDAEKSPWTQVCQRALPILPGAANTTPDQLSGLISKNLVYGTVSVDDRSLMVNGLFLKSNLVVIPNHYFLKDTIEVVFRKENPETSGGKFTVKLSKKKSYSEDGSDIRYCYADSGGSFKDLTKYLTDEELPEHEFSMLWRSKQGKLTIASGLATPADTSNGAADFRGYKYEKLTMNTFKGLCGAVLMSKRKAIITSIHLGGKSDTPRGCSGKLMKSTVEKAIDELRKNGAVFSGSAEKFETQVLSVNVLTNQPLHPKSPLNYMPHDSQVEYYGSCPGMSTFRSDVKKSLISDVVSEVTGVENVYGPPIELPQYVGWQSCLANLANPAKPFDPDILDMAIEDYKCDMIPIFQSRLWRNARPLTDDENLCGIPGKKFMDAIKLNTSIGFPLSGPKRNFVTEFQPTPDKPNNRRLDDVIMDEIKRCEDCYRRGERAYTIAKACKKDEVLSKPKCRIFYSNSIALTWLIRKYYLPILRVMQMNPLKSECAVGINSHGPEWDTLHKHIHKFGEDRLFGGDYGKYDQKLPSQLIFAALRIMMDFARECDYTQEDLAIMEAMTGDIVYAVIAFNGDLIGLTSGTHISGNSLTVIINGICGSLNLRCFFYTLYPYTCLDDRKPFRDFVALVTYGDDNIGSVSDKIDGFTIKNVSEFLGNMGQIYTMPDKESELLDFLPVHLFEFLKRTSVYHPELGVYLGALVDKSIWKMLHAYLRPKDSPLTEEHACAQNIDTALREWFNHGESVYEQRRLQLKEIAHRTGIGHLCKELDVQYFERVEQWKDRHIRKEYVSFGEPDGFTC